MPISTVKNQWGSQGSKLEPHRSDLWVVIFDQQLLAACAKIDPTISVSSEETFCIEAESVSMPEERINTDEFFQDGGNILRLPGYDQSIESVRITFRVPVPRPGTMPRIVALLKAWKNLVRSGRDGSGVTRRQKSVTLTATGQLQPFRFSLYIDMLAGNDYSHSGTRFSQVQQMIDGQIKDQNFALTPAFRAHCVNAWVGAFQYSEISYKQTDLATISAQIYAASVDFEPLSGVYSPVQGRF